MQNDISTMLPPKPATSAPANNMKGLKKTSQEMPVSSDEQLRFSEYLVKTGKGADEAGNVLGNILNEAVNDLDDLEQATTDTTEQVSQSVSRNAQLYSGQGRAELSTGLPGNNKQAENADQAPEAVETNELMMNAVIVAETTMPASNKLQEKLQYSLNIAKVPLVAAEANPARKTDKGKTGPLTARSANMLTKVRVDKTMQELFRQTPQGQVEPALESHKNIKARPIIEKMSAAVLGPKKQVTRLVTEMQVNVSHTSQERHVLPEMTVHPAQQIASAIAGVLDTATKTNRTASVIPEQFWQMRTGEAKLARHLHITLHPENLGTVSARLVKEGAGLKVVLEPSTVDMANRLKSEITQLAKQIHLSGISPDDLTIRITVPDAANIQRGQDQNPAGQQSQAGSFADDKMQDQASYSDREHRWNDGHSHQENDNDDNHPVIDGDSLYL